MAKRVKNKKRTLRQVLLQYLCTTLALCALAGCVWLVALSGLIDSGLMLPSNAAELATNEAYTALQGAQSLDESTLPSLCRWALFDSAKHDAKILRTNLQGWHLRAAQRAWQNFGTGELWYTSVDGKRITVYQALFGKSQYHCTVYLGDGTACLLQYDFTQLYADETLRGRLPAPDVMLGLLLLALLAVGIAVSTRRTGRFLSAEAARLTAASEKIAAQELDSLVFTRAQVREFDAALTAMQTLGQNLTTALQNQWAAEQQRAEQTAALAHDLKTPLTVIVGNAELLAEEPLTDAQRPCVASILRGAGRAQQYLADLRSVNTVGQAETAAPVDAVGFLAARGATGAALCAPKKVEFALESTLPDGFVFMAQAGQLARAVDNLLDNAARHTPAGGRVTLRCTTKEGILRFAVADSGPGFTPAALQKAGQLLYTGDTARTAGGHQGFGLYFCRQVAQAHGGRVEIKNKTPGPGAEVVLAILIAG